MAAEQVWKNIDVEYSKRGRVILTSKHYPSFISHVFPRACSDNILLIAQKPMMDSQK